MPENEPSESAPETSEPAVIAPEATTVETDEDGNPIHGGGGEGGDDANIGADGEGGGAADGGVPLITGKMLATIGAIIGGFAVLVGGLFLLLYYARRASDAKEALIGSFERELSEEELRTNTRKLMDFLHAMLADRGLQIGYGELPRTYAARVDTTLRGPSMREVWSLMEKQEFGFGVEADEAKELATYTSNVWKYMKRKTSPWRRAYLHLIRHTL